jgi:SHS2 domain-containing protein
MPFRYLEDRAIADVAFEAWGASLQELFIAAADATVNVMISDLSTIQPREQRHLWLEDEDADMLLFRFLQEMIFYKDAERLLLRVRELEIPQQEGLYLVLADAYGERIDVNRHELLVDVKAVTLHRFSLTSGPGGWKAEVVLDV